MSIKTSCFEVHLSDDDGDDSTDDNKKDKLFGESNRSNSLEKEDIINNKNENDYEIGFYMHLTDDITDQNVVKYKGDQNFSMFLIRITVLTDYFKFLNFAFVQPLIAEFFLGFRRFIKNLG